MMLQRLGGLSSLIRRLAFLTVGLFLMALGIAIATRADLGTTPISAPPYVLSLAYEWTLGQFSFAMFFVLVALQWILLRGRFHPAQLLQLPLGLAFGMFIDLGMWLTQILNPEHYALQVLQLVAGSAVLALGVVVQVTPHLLYTPGEGTVVALARVARWPFARMKTLFDASLVTIAVVMSFVIFGELVGLREGTILSALLIGTFAKPLGPPIRRLAARLGAMPPAGDHPE